MASLTIAGPVVTSANICFPVAASSFDVADKVLLVDASGCGKADSESHETGHSVDMFVASFRCTLEECVSRASACISEELEAGEKDCRCVGREVRSRGAGVVDKRLVRAKRGTTARGMASS